MSATKKHNYLVFSDVHLGSDLVHHVRPWTVGELKQVAKIDRELSAMLDWYRANANPDVPWRLVVAGDLVDFIGMSIAPEPGANLELNDEEREYGLGATDDHAACKMRAVAARHALIFERLAAFLSDGHTLVLVRGNHDIDFHWPSAQRAFVDALLAHRPELAGDADARAVFEGRIEFYPWFYYEEGLLYVEHGHQFDAMCSYHHLLAPVSPVDPRRICWSFSDILLRQVVRPTPGIGSEGHEHRTALAYVRLGLSLGLRGAFRLFYRYAAATLGALRRWRANVGAGAARIRADHEGRLHDLAERMRIQADKLRALSALWPRPVTGAGLSVLRSMFIDRILLTITVLLVAVTTGVFVPWAWWFPLSVALLLGAAALWVRSARARHRDLDPTVHMHLAAGYIVRLLPSRYVVMGHTHAPAAVAVGSGATYVNVGNWGVDTLDDPGAADPPRTHFVLEWIGGHPVARFLRWDPATGPVEALPLPERPSAMPGPPGDPR